MKLLLNVLLIVFCIAILNAQTVYVTKTGTKYHSAGCSYLKSSIPIDLKDIGAKYSPCSRCSPPTSINESKTESKSVNKTENTTVKKQTSTTTSSQCNGITKKGKRCKRMVKGGGNCWQH